jgi:L-galactose dehydrogenase
VVFGPDRLFCRGSEPTCEHDPPTCALLAALSFMQYRLLGRTGLNVSVLGLGTGTRFGDRRNQSTAEATTLVRTALDFGINYIDTAAMYLEAEAMLGAALEDVPRDRFILATKFFPATGSGVPISAAQLRQSVERSLRDLRLETIDVLQVHGLRPHWTNAVFETLGSELDALRAEGKYRFLGAAETIVEDPRHEMLQAVASLGRIDSALVAYSLLSPWAEISALPECASRGVGVVAMVAVRRALRDPAMLARLIREAQVRGEPGVMGLPAESPLGWLLDEHSHTLTAAGYRFAIAHPAVSCVLSGTLSIEHLKANIAAACAPRMPEEQRTRIRSIFLQTDPAHWRAYDL